VGPLRDDQDVGLRTMDWGSGCGILPTLIGHMGQRQGTRFVVLVAEPTRFCDNVQETASNARAELEVAA
jgi:hypothetical protein